MPVFDSLKEFSFGSIAFPYVTYKITGGIRDKVHEYPHNAGGAVEKLGRKLYEVNVTAEFLAGALSAKYGTLWPDGLAALRALYESQTTAELHVPTVGTFRAYCVTWDEEAKNTKRNGVTATFTFREDQNEAFLVNKLVEIDRASLATQLDDWEAAIKAQLIDDPDTTDLFDGITASVNGILAIKDQLDLYGSAVASKITTLALLCDQADRQVNELDSLEFQNVRDALHELWLSATRLRNDIAEKTAKMRQFTTPFEMTINAVARAVGIENPAEVMQLNALTDPLAIPANTVIRYYEAA